MMEAMARVKGRVKGCAAIAAVVEEETGRSTGARKLLETYTPAAAVIGEPTGLRVAIAHKGAIRPYHHGPRRGGACLPAVAGH